MRTVRQMLNIATARDKKRSTICSAIRQMRTIEFYYHGGYRTVEPFVLGIVMEGEADNESLICYQTDGYSELLEVVGWKLYRASEMENIVVKGDHFSGDRPGYEPDTVEMATIYCCVRPRGEVPAVEVEPPKIEAPPPIVVVAPPVPEKPKKPVTLFSTSYIRMIRLARRLNQNKKIWGDVYFYPTERRVEVRSIDLGIANPLCEVNKKPGAGANANISPLWRKRWLEAYFIGQAKRNKWKLGLEKHEYSFLLSQLRFKKDTSKGERKRGILDLLLYNEEKRHLVALWLVVQPELEVLNAVIAEMAGYAEKIKKGIDEGFFAKAFDLGEIKGLFVHVVCAHRDTYGKLGNYGLIEFPNIENPWELHQEMGKELEIKLTSKRGALNLM